MQFSYNEPVINGFHGVTYNIDGAPLPLATTSNFAEIIDPKLIDSIELLTGAIPAEYGGDRMGGVVNIISNRPTDIPQGTYGTVTGGFGNQGQGIGEFDLESRSGLSEFFLSANTNTTNRGLDAPTYVPINDDSSSSDQFFRAITQLTPREYAGFRLLQSVLAVSNSDQYGSEQSARSGRERARHARHAARVRPLFKPQLDPNLAGRQRRSSRLFRGGARPASTTTAIFRSTSSRSSPTSASARRPARRPSI